MGGKLELLTLGEEAAEDGMPDGKLNGGGGGGVDRRRGGGGRTEFNGMHPRLRNQTPAMVLRLRTSGKMSVSASPHKDLGRLTHTTQVIENCIDLGLIKRRARRRPRDGAFNNTDAQTHSNRPKTPRAQQVSIIQEINTHRSHPNPFAASLAHPNSHCGRVVAWAVTKDASKNKTPKVAGVEDMALRKSGGSNEYPGKREAGASDLEHRYRQNEPRIDRDWNHVTTWSMQHHKPF
ncbi:hypothetical protein C8R44DRAFT_735835 [Mycena epipterygia]|nr:hypothetical protein C8R44DRAFT_735835 [Mycena epipterygia]